jgi:hypothetical protein
MLVISGMLVLLAYQPVSSQLISITQTTTESYTITSITTGSSTTYSTTTNTGTIRYLHRPYDYDYRTGTFTLEENEAIMTMPFEGAGHICLYYDYFVFNAVASQEIRGHLATASPINFYVLDLNQLIAFNNYFCGNNFGPSIVKAFVSSYDLDWTPLSTGVYVFLFATQSLYGAYNSISFIAYTYNTIIQSTTLSYATTSLQILQKVETVVSSLITTASTQNESGTFLPVFLSIFGLVIVFILIVAVKKRRSKP